MFAAISAPAAHASYVGAVTADGPFAYYRLNESTNSSPAADQQGSNPGTYQNGPAVLVPGPLASDPANTAASFNRTANQYVRLTTMGNYGSTMGLGFSVEFWMKTADSTDYQVLYGAANTGGFVTDFLTDIAVGGTAGRLRLYFRDDGNQRYQTDFTLGGGNTNLYDNQWHHVAEVYDPSAAALADRVLFYADGVRQSVNVSIAGNGSNPSLSNFNVPLTVGAMDLRGTIQDYYQGSLDEVAFYTKTLSAGQVLNHFQAASTPEPATCVLLGFGAIFLAARRRRP